MGIFSSRVWFAMATRPLALGLRSVVRARLRDLALRRINLTYGRRAFTRLHLDSAFGGEGSGGGTILRIGVLASAF
jgi:hypothetical protein